MAASCAAKPESPRTSAPDVETLLTDLVAGEGEGRAEILSIDIAPTPKGNGHRACGVARVRGHIEPFMAMTLGTFPHHEKATANIVRHEDRDGDGASDGSESGWDALNRKLTLTVCDNLEPPEGVVWVTERKPNPDPEQAERSRALASTLADVLVPAAD